MRGAWIFLGFTRRREGAEIFSFVMLAPGGLPFQHPFFSRAPWLMSRDGRDVSLSVRQAMRMVACTDSTKAIWLKYILAKIDKVCHLRYLLVHGYDEHLPPRRDEKLG